jgi:FXSXX-COOH protein
MRASMEKGLVRSARTMTWSSSNEEVLVRNGHTLLSHPATAALLRDSLIYQLRERTLAAGLASCHLPRTAMHDPSSANGTPEGCVGSTINTFELPQGGVPLDESDEFVTDLVDLSDVPLADLRSLDHPILTKALERVAEEARDSVDVVAGFQAAI